MPTKHPFFKDISRASVALSNTCNLLCKGCGVEAQSKGAGGKASELSFKDVEPWFKEAKNLGIKSVYLWGGEPTYWTGDPTIPATELPTEQFFQLLGTAKENFSGSIQFLSNGLWARDPNNAVYTVARVREETEGRGRIIISADPSHRTVDKDGSCKILDNIHHAIQEIDPTMRVEVQYMKLLGAEKAHQGFMQKYSSAFDINVGVWNMKYPNLPSITSLPPSERDIKHLQENSLFVTARPIDGYPGLFEKCLGKDPNLMPGGSMGNRGEIYACHCYSFKIGQVSGDHVEWDTNVLDVTNAFIDGIRQEGMTTYIRRRLDCLPGPLKDKVTECLSTERTAKSLGCYACSLPIGAFEVLTSIHPSKHQHVN